MLSGVEVDNSITEVNGIAFFPGRTDSGDFHLWRSDGTAAGTYQVSDVPVWVVNHSPQYMANVNGTLFFVGNDPASGPELWKSDGTQSGTVLVKDIRPAELGSYPGDLTEMNGTLFFNTFDGSKRNLWKSDGTASGTVLVKNITVNNQPYLTNVNGTLFFKGNDGASGYELWRSDGSDAGTVRVKDINAGSGGSDPDFLTNVNGTVFFTANDGTSGFELWRSDGTANGTIMLTSGSIGNTTNSNGPKNLAAVGGTLFFSEKAATLGRELWKSDGTTSGTTLVADLRTGSSGSYPAFMTSASGNVVFSAVTGVGLGEVWRSDGTSGGTKLIKDALAGAHSVLVPRYFTKVNGTVFFSAGSDTGGYQLFKTDLTSGGTLLLKTFTGAGFAMPQYLTNTADRLLFSSTDSTGRQVLWASDGTAAGTIVLDPSAPTNRPPVAMNDSVNWTEDGGQIIADPPGALANDSDADHDPLTAILDTGAQHGTLTFGSAGNFRYQPNPNFFGTDQFTYHASDGTANSNVATVTINVAAVNDPPEFSVGIGPGSTDDAGPQTIDDWCSDASPGPNEAGQTLTFQATADHPELFAAQPQIDGSGRLTFTPALNAIGTAMITVVLSDDGGVAGGGSDHSEPQTFPIEIYKLAPWKNSVDRLDVNNDQAIAPNDALDVINFLNAFGSRRLEASDGAGPPYYDVDGDQFVAPIDALMVINWINSHPAAEGESSGALAGASAIAASPNTAAGAPSSGDLSALIALLANDVSEVGTRRRR